MRVARHDGHVAYRCARWHPGLVLVVVGGPTHMHGLTTALSRRLAAEGAKEDGHATLEPGATDELGLRGWLRDLAAADGIRAAAFDTRLDCSAALTGAAARGIARRLRRHGYDVVATESFLVEDAEGPLEDGELERARRGARSSRVGCRASDSGVS